MRRNRRTVNSDGVRLAVRDSGSQGKPVVLVHGLGYGQHSWDRVVPCLLSIESGASPAHF
jgi:pimeloyl-ACP methyl ester carboxylesterase